MPRARLPSRPEAVRVLCPGVDVVAVASASSVQTSNGRQRRHDGSRVDVDVAAASRPITNMAIFMSFRVILVIE